jgi:hypothetical protein
MCIKSLDNQILIKIKEIQFKPSLPSSGIPSLKCQTPPHELSGQLGANRSLGQSFIKI